MLIVLIVWNFVLMVDSVVVEVVDIDIVDVLLGVDDVDVEVDEIVIVYSVVGFDLVVVEYDVLDISDELIEFIFDDDLCNVDDVLLLDV